MTLNEGWIRSVMSGQASGLINEVLRSGLRAISIPYGGVVRLRNACFRNGWRKIHKVPVPVVSIGNVTTGGTGKTPLVALTIRTLIHHSARPAIISRGYRSGDHGTNDEFQVLSQLCPGVIHRQHADRVSLAQQLAADGEADVIVMDDGFQHRRLHRDLDIVLIDATNPFGHGFLLPRGLLREPLTSLRRADVILLTRTDLVSEARLLEIRETVDRILQNAAIPVLEIQFAPGCLLSINGSVRSLQDVAGRSAFLMSGIGNPQAFEQTCRNAGVRVVGSTAFLDHHHYSAEDLQEVRRQASRLHAEMILTTQKDLVKLPESTDDIVAITIEAKFPCPEEQRVFDHYVATALGMQPQ